MNRKDQSPIPGLTIAGPDDLKALQPQEVHMDDRWLVYLNAKVLEMLGASSRRRISHVRFVPDVSGGLLYILPCRAEDYGATPLTYTPTGNGARVSLYLALRRFDLPREKGKVRAFEVRMRPVMGSGTFLALDVRTSRLIPSARGRRRRS